MSVDLEMVIQGDLIYMRGECCDPKGFYLPMDWLDRLNEEISKSITYGIFVMRGPVTFLFVTP